MHEKSTPAKSGGDESEHIRGLPNQHPSIDDQITNAIFHQSINQPENQSARKPITMSSSSFAVQSIDHVVLTVASIQATVDFYTKHLGMTHETFVSGDGVER